MSDFTKGRCKCAWRLAGLSYVCDMHQEKGGFCMETKKAKNQKAEEVNQVITLRLDHERLERLKKYCESKGWTRSRAMREFIDLLS